jgi:hypothetical protein
MRNDVVMSKGRADRSMRERTPAEMLLDQARARFAHSGRTDLPSRKLGSIVLRSDQIETARRVRAHLHRHGGCLLADDVGTGKTFVALAVARDRSRPLVVVPASLRSTWEQAARLADVRCRIVTHEALSRGSRPSGSFDAIVVDESHRFRSTSRRHAELARLAAYAPVLLLSATPLQNRATELAAQLALFLGEGAYRLDEAELTRWIVRSAMRTELALPRVSPPRWLDLDADDGDVLRAILALPPPPRAFDAGDGGALLLLSLVRAWASSQAALVATIRRRRRTLVAIEQCHAEGRVPTRAELRSWRSGGDVQLGFATLLASTSLDRGSADEMASAIAAERHALGHLLDVIASNTDPDGARVAALRALRSTHADEPILAFSESASTVRAYFAALRADAGVGMLTAGEARIATGRIGRDELVARFAPRAQRSAMPAAHQRVTLLLSTDLLSEGVNLQDASVVVHLDLPWNPARLTQRIGRVRRPGGAPSVSSNLMSPPARAGLLLRAESRLRTKLARAEHTIGRGIAVLPALSGIPPSSDEGNSPEHARSGASLSTAESWGEIDRMLVRWRAAVAESSTDGLQSCIAAAVRAHDRGWIALLDDGRLLASHRSDHTSADGSCYREPTDAPDAVADALIAADGQARDAPGHECDSAMSVISDWIAHDWSRHSCGLTNADSPMRRRLLRAVDGAVRHPPRHRRVAALTTAASLRRALAGPLPLGVERELDALGDGDRDDWLARADALLARVPPMWRAEAAQPPSVRALILLGDGRLSTSGSAVGRERDAAG